MPGLRKRTLGVLLVTAAVLGIGTGTVLVGGAGADQGSGNHRGGGHAYGHGFPPSVAHVDLSGYVIEAKYTLGANAGNTFQQTYTADMVQGVPVAGPFVGQTFPAAHYVALAIAPQTVYIAWLNDQSAIVDAFVMNFRTGVVFDYAPHPGPESSGTVRIVKQGTHPIP
jgi:hypothetical protein